MQYFKHLGNMRHDRKIKNLIFKYGLKGYGLYCIILESIVEKICNDRPEPELEESCEELARFYNSDTTEINEMANYMINQGLLSLNEITCRIECHKIYKYLEQSQTRSDQIRELIKKYKNNTSSLIQLPCMSETVIDKSDRIEKNRIEKEKKKIKSKKYNDYPDIKNYRDNVKLREQDYNSLIAKYGDKQVNIMLDKLSAYKLSKDKKYASDYGAINTWVIEACNCEIINNKSIDIGELYRKKAEERENEQN